MGISDEQATSSLRITLGRYTTTTSIEKLADILAKLVAFA
jgi:cysteine sulfinate desulfinase/cysteine desulfurase-like protein